LDTVLKALAPAVPDLVPAGHKADQGDFGFYGIDSSTGKYWFCGSIRGGGHGGRPHEDGESASVNILQGDVPTAQWKCWNKNSRFSLKAIASFRTQLGQVSLGVAWAPSGAFGHLVLMKYSAILVVSVSSVPVGPLGGKPAMGNTTCCTKVEVRNQR